MSEETKTEEVVEQKETVDTNSIFKKAYSEGKESATKNLTSDILSKAKSEGLEVNTLDDLIEIAKAKSESPEASKEKSSKYEALEKQVEFLNNKLETTERARLEAEKDFKISEAISKLDVHNSDIVKDIFKSRYNVETNGFVVNKLTNEAVSDNINSVLETLKTESPFLFKEKSKGTLSPTPDQFTSATKQQVSDLLSDQEFHRRSTAGERRQLRNGEITPQQARDIARNRNL